VYCNFHFSTSDRLQNNLIESILLEIEQRKSYLKDEKINSIYFGGGTPSILSIGHLHNILSKVFENFNVDTNAEITLEANPEDLTEIKLSQLKEVNINRLSIGIQSFHNDDLKFLNRSHSSSQAIQCIESAKKIGFGNISTDLIFGIQNADMNKWKQNLDMASDLGIPHLSCYSLTVEDKTALAYFVKKGISKPVNDKQQKEQFEYTHEFLTRNGFLHYEISNYCREGFLAVHNTGYWKDMKYLGIGPSAHSFNGKSRQWNISNNALYIKKTMNHEPAFEIEHIDLKTKYNEYIMTRLRTMWGIDFHELQSRFGEDNFTCFQKTLAQKHTRDCFTINGNNIVLNSKGKLIADSIISGFFIV
jgi:putative oxygen-independent coproporphyrinogen III oxidase